LWLTFICWAADLGFEKPRIEQKEFIRGTFRRFGGSLAILVIGKRGAKPIQQDASLQIYRQSPEQLHFPGYLSAP
jgi:hypothetical protein